VNVQHVAVVGGGLAGMAAAEAARRLGLRVELFEARLRLAGRAGSSRDARSGQWITGQHVALACCTELLDFCRRLGIDDCFERHTRLSFLGPDGRVCPWSAARWLPAPLHLVPSFLGLKYLTVGERLRTIALLASLIRARAGDGLSMSQWLREHGCSPREEELFWVPVLAPALGELPDRVAVGPAAQVFREAVMGARDGYHMLVPRLPLGEMYDQRAGQRLAELGVNIFRGARVQQIEGDAHGVSGVLLTDGRRVTPDAVVLAVSWRRVRRLLSPALVAALPELNDVEQIPAGAITGVHLWFDRPLHGLPHAALPGRVSQWIFQPEVGTPQPAANAVGHYYQVVVSASHRVAPPNREELVAVVCRELAETFPAARQARLVHHRVVIDPGAVFVLAPGVDRLRPGQRTGVPNLFLAGDWTRTGWPATMEGAVRSGRRAIAALSGGVTD
jgi:squalene-associated FAD-dependent desaturase